MRNMPLILQIFIMALWLSVIPMAVGGCFRNLSEKTAGSGRLLDRLLFRWVSGQMLLWACFQLVCVPCVILEKDFQYVVYDFGAASCVLVFAGVWRTVSSRGKQLKSVKSPSMNSRKTRTACILWTCFGVLLLLQLVQAVRLTYADGDDAYYVAVSTITENAETMYQKLPYTGGATNVDIRHGLAPFPIWIAFLSRVSGIQAVTTAHVAAPLMLILMTYMIFYLLGRRLLVGREKYLPLFLIFTELLILFGDYSFYTVENFMLARSRQGKAALGSIVFPMLLFLLFVLLDRLSEQKKSGKSYWALLCCTMMTGCLCSTLGSFLMCLFVAVTGLCAAVSYRQWKMLLPMALCCVPCVCYALMYLLS